MAMITPFERPRFSAAAAWARSCSEYCAGEGTGAEAGLEAGAAPLSLAVTSFSPRGTPSMVLKPSSSGASTGFPQLTQNFASSSIAEPQ